MQLLRPLFSSNLSEQAYDRQLLVVALSLMGVGMVIVASASIPEGIALADDPFRFLKRHLIYIVLCLSAMAFVVNIPTIKWFNWSGWLLFTAFAALMLVLIIGTEVNGSHRWLRVGAFNIQPAEFAKLAIILFLSAYLVRRQKEVVDKIRGFIKPLAMLSAFALLLLLQPDLGSTVVIVTR